MIQNTVATRVNIAINAFVSANPSATRLCGALKSMQMSFNLNTFGLAGPTQMAPNQAQFGSQMMLRLEAVLKQPQPTQQLAAFLGVQGDAQVQQEISGGGGEGPSNQCCDPSSDPNCSPSNACTDSNNNSSACGGAASGSSSCSAGASSGSSASSGSCGSASADSGSSSGSSAGSCGGSAGSSGSGSGSSGGCSGASGGSSGGGSGDGGASGASGGACGG